VARALGWAIVTDPQFGAKLNGITDDTAAIQAALDSRRIAGGGTVFIPVGTGIVSSYLRIGSNTTLAGTGAGSVLQLINNAPDTASSDIIHNWNLNNGFPAALPGVTGVAVAYLAGSGTLAAATYSYRVSATNAVGENLASVAVTGVATASSARMQVSWTAVTGATGYNVFGRVGGSEQMIAQGVTGTSFIDDGTITPMGLVSDYDYSNTRATTQDVNITLRDLTLDGNKANNAGLTQVAGAVYFNNVDGVTVQNVRVRNTVKHGIANTWVSNSSYVGNVFTACGTTGSYTALLFYHRASGVTIAGNTISGCGFGILTDHGSNKFSVTGNVVTGSTDSGIGFDEGSWSMVATGNTCQGNGNAGIIVTDGQTGRRTHDITVTGNVCTDNANDGIVFSGTDLFTCSGNTVARNSIGIRTTVGYAQNARRGNIVGNTVMDNIAQGMYLTASTKNCTVAANRIGGNGSHGLEMLSVSRIDVKHNTSSNNNSSNGAGFVCGIKLSGTSADNVIVGNTCTNDVSTFGQHAGIYLAGTTNTATRYGGNVVFNNKTNQFYSDTPANDIALTY
jgi:parallel beta-helix repeat protein